MLLAIDIGNTNIVFGIHSGEAWLSNWRIQTDADKTADEYEVIFRTLISNGHVPSGEVSSVVLSSVVPTLVQPFIDMIASFLDRQPVIVGPEIYDKLPIGVLNPYQIGSDLVVNSLAAYLKYGEFTMVIDFGTALTFTTIGTGGKILGVAIAPGKPPSCRVFIWYHPRRSWGKTPCMPSSRELYWVIRVSSIL